MVVSVKFALATENIPGPTPSKGCRRVNFKLESNSSLRNVADSMADCSEPDNSTVAEVLKMVLNRSKALREDQATATTKRISATILTTTFWLAGSGQKYRRNMRARVTRPPREPVAAMVTGVQRSISRHANFRADNPGLVRSTKRQNGMPISRIRAR